MRYAIALAAVAAAMAAAPAGFQFWKASELQAMEKKLAPRINAQKFANETIGKYGNHLVMVAHRQGDGESEVHETQADIFVVQKGTARLVYGGEVVGGKTTAPGEIRGTSIKGGETRPLAPGDIVHIPAKVPHQVLLEAGKQFTYVIVKVDTK